MVTRAPGHAVHRALRHAVHRALCHAIVVASVLGSAACLRATEYHCTESAQCTGGTCQPVGYCSFADPGCASGQQFGDSAGTYAGQCVGGEGVDGGVDAPGDAPIDTPVDTAGGCPGTYAAIAGGQGTHVYRVLAPAMWTAQKQACAADGANAYLVIPDDAAELMAINAALPQITMDYWIGVDDQATEGTYLNAKGAPQTFLPWDTGQPNNINNSDCVEVHHGDRSWNDTSCGNVEPALCECEP